MDQLNRPIANPVVVLREEFDDWAVLFNPDTAAAVGTNPVGVAIWKLLNGKRSIDNIMSEIKSAFSDAPDSAVKEITTFIDALAEKGFAGLELERK